MSSRPDWHHASSCGSLFIERSKEYILAMTSGSFVSLSPCDTENEIGTEMSIAFVCGQVKREAENPKSNANTIIRKLRNNMILEDIISLKLLLYDTSGTPLKQDLINYKYDCSFFPAIKPEMLEDPCYPHCHMDGSLQRKNKIEQDLVQSECEEIIKFIRKNKNAFSQIRKLKLVCCHFINIPDNLQFMFRISRRLTTIEKVDENNIGPIFDLNEPAGQHGYTPWRFTIGS